MPPKDPFADPHVLMAALAALDNPHRLRILAKLAGGRAYVSELARQLDLGRPLLHMHLEKLEAAGLVRSTHEVAPDGKANRFCEAVPFALHLDLARITQAMKSWTPPK